MIENPASLGVVIVGAGPLVLAMPLAMDLSPRCLATTLIRCFRDFRALLGTSAPCAANVGTCRGPATRRIGCGDGDCVLHESSGAAPSRRLT